jgi:hypothetical protein
MSDCAQEWLSPYLRDGKFEILTKFDLMDTIAVLMEQKR